jgi:membrane protease YdiL (CAAX protease family)
LSKGRLWSEIIIAFALVEAALWIEGPVRAVMTSLAAAWIIGMVWLEHPSLREIGLGKIELAPSAWIVAAAAAVAGSIIVVGRVAGSSRYPFRTSVPAHVAAYLPWSLAQQFASQSFFFRRLKGLLDPRMAVAATAVLFSAAHLPNPVLAPATLAAGVLLSELYRRYGSLYPLAAAHALLALAIAVAVPDAVHRHMHVGIGYLRYHAALPR